MGADEEVGRTELGLRSHLLSLYCSYGLGPTLFDGLLLHILMRMDDSSESPTGNGDGESRNVPTPASPDGDEYFTVKLPVGS
ncbi:unnamed protein product [Urochloa humidicola]